MANREDDELKRAFFLESSEILEAIENGLALVEKNPADLEAVNALFRGLHTIKGNSSFLGLDNVTKVSHAAENLLDKARKKEIPVSKDFITLVRLVFEDLKRMIEEQQPNLDITGTVHLIQRFLAGDASGIAKFRAAATPEAAFKGANLLTNNVTRVEDSKIAKILTLASELELLRYSFEKFPEKMDILGPVAEDLRFEIDLQVSKLSRLTRSLSSIIFGVRLVPVNQVFKRFPRVVSELAQKLGKKVELKIVNGEAELDKAIVDAIADPMTHLIRNSADHGIETEAERKATKKPPVGSITLNSYVRGNFVFIEISDDGRGIDGDKILKKAIEKGIVPADKAASFTELQKLGLIFAPGFSTAEKVTDISGRGVGMDVVKSNINKLKGTVIINSKVGQGTTIQLRFPMSMVVLFSLFVDVNGCNCAIPVEQIDESLDYHRGELKERPPEDQKQGEYLRLYSLRSLLWGEKENLAAGHEVFHTLRFKDGSGTDCAFIVDDFLSIEEAIVQSLDSYIAALPGLQGATVRKDGSVALVLNPISLMELAAKAQPFAYAKKKSPFASDEASLSDFLGISA